jgi:hypothetical protein
VTVQPLFDEVADRMLHEDPELAHARMMNSFGLKTGRKFFAMVVRGELVVKLPRDRVEALLEDGAGHRFDPGHGRPMKEWICLRPADEAACEGYMREARAYVAGLAAA